jgi:hypothetical protein
VLVLGEEALEENMEPGGVASGLLAGYLALYDELGLEELVARAAEKIAPEGYILQRGGRRIDFGALARARRLTCLKPPQRLEADSGGRDSLSSHAAQSYRTSAASQAHLRAPVRLRLRTKFKYWA